MNSPCPCCHKAFEFYPESALDGLCECPHCQSVLKWENNSFEVIQQASGPSKTSSSQVEPLEHPSLVKDEASKAPFSAQVDEGFAENDDESSSFLEAKGPTEEGPSVVTDSPSEQHSSEQEAKGPTEEGPSVVTDSPSEQHSSEQEAKGPTEEGPSVVTDSPSEQHSSEQEAKGPTEEGPSVVTDSPSEQQMQSPQLEVLHSQGAEEALSEPKPQDFSDVENYGNSESISSKGFLRYDLLIEGIDSSEIEEQILFILEDSRFNWDGKEIYRQQKDGNLWIKNLHPIKVVSLISEISRLSVQLSWKQYTALSSSSQAPSTNTSDQDK